MKALDRRTDKQTEIIDYHHKHRPIVTILHGAVRSGKTYLNNGLWIDHLYDFRGRGVKFIMTGTTISSLKRNVLDDIEMMFHTPISLNKNNEFKIMGNTVACFGTKDTDSYKAMKGFTSYGWYGNEVTEHHRNSVDQAVKRCSGEGTRIFLDTNPGGPKHFIKTQFIDKSGETLNDGRAYVKAWNFKLDDNEFLDPLYVESLKRSTPSGVWYDRDILGQWVAAEGMIYRDFSYDEHVIDNVPSIKEYFAGVDWGFEHNGVIGLYGIDNDGVAIRLKEIVSRHKTIDWWIQQAKYLQQDYGNITFYCDPARPDFIKQFRNEGLSAREADNSVVEGIIFVAGLMKKKRLYIFEPMNKDYLDEIYTYRWKENAAKEEPVKELDDSMDSERYALFTHLGKSRKITATKSLYR